MSEIVGYALSRQLNLIDGGDRLELPSNLEPVVLTATISPAANGCMVRSRIEVPAQGFYCLVSAFVVLVAMLLVAASTCDLMLGTHLLRTRSRTNWDLDTGSDRATLCSVLRVSRFGNCDPRDAMAENSSDESRGGSDATRIVDKLFEVSCSRSRWGFKLQLWPCLAALFRPLPP